MAQRTHTDRTYETELRELRDALLRMAGRVESMIRDSTRAFLERDEALARATIKADNAVNRAEVDIDDLCLRILACRQPMAGDLRFIIQAMKMVTDLERIGDLAVNISERAIDLGDAPRFEGVVGLTEMGPLVESMVHDAIDAFVERDAPGACAVVARDDQVDALYHQAFRDLLAQMAADPDSVTRGVHVQSVAKWLERIGDHATNLAEMVVFLVRGQDIRHEGKLGGE